MGRVSAGRGYQLGAGDCPTLFDALHDGRRGRHRLGNCGAPHQARHRDGPGVGRRKVAQGMPAPVAEMLLGTYQSARRGDFATAQTLPEDVMTSQVPVTKLR